MSEELRRKGLEDKKWELGEERLKYEEGCPYEIYLCGVIQGIHYALTYPHGIIAMRVEIEGKSKEEDKKK